MSEICHGVRRSRIARIVLLAAVLAVPGRWVGSQTEERRNGTVNFSFDQVSIPAFVKLVGEITGRKFVVADDVQGKITVVSPQVSRDAVYSLFVSILESAGCSIVQEGDVGRIVLLSRRETPAAPVVGPGESLPSEGIVTKVFRLEHVRVTELRKLLESRVGGGKAGAVGVVEETNHLVVTDTAAGVRRIEKLIAQIDRPGLARVTEVVVLAFAAAEDLAEELNRAMAEEMSRAERLLRRLPAAGGEAEGGSFGATVVASPHSNSLILVGSASQVEQLKRLIGLMDVDTPSGRGRLNAIFLRYLSAEQAAKDIGALLAGAEAVGKDPLKEKRRVAIQASIDNNALLVDASPGDFEVVRKLVEQLDQLPDQVQIEVLIAELSVGDSLNIGVDMAALNMPDEPGSTVVVGANTLGESTDALMNLIQQGIFPSGLTIGAARGVRVDADGNVVADYPGVISIEAVKKDSRFKIRANPLLVAQNNKEATVNIVNEIPILASTIAGGSGTSRDVIQNIERVDVGIKLKLTPHVIPGGDVRMQLSPSIEAVIDPGPESTPFTPTIAKREVSTTVTVRDRDTIVIAGLMREDASRTVRKVPLLGSIPLLGWLFRNTADTTEKTNLLILVTPRIVTDGAEARLLREELETRTGLSSDEQAPNPDP